MAWTNVFTCVKMIKLSFSHFLHKSLIEMKHSVESLVNSDDTIVVHNIFNILCILVLLIKKLKYRNVAQNILLNYQFKVLSDYKTLNQNLLRNKKVLPPERKRHTARRIASTRYAALCNPDLVGGVPGVPPHHPDLVGGYPIQIWSGGTPSKPNWGWYPIQTWSGGTPSRPGQGYPIQTWSGGILGTPSPSRPVMGYPPDLRWGTPHHPDLGWGTPQTWDGVPPTIQTWDGVPSL